MNRSPLYYPLSRGGDLDAGGAADLQTDIMRFMAILALCLVAIFALVQSIPLEPVTNVAAPSPMAEPEPAALITAPPVTPTPKPEARTPKEVPAQQAPKRRRVPGQAVEQPLKTAAQQLPPAAPASQDLPKAPTSQLPAAIPRPTPAPPPAPPVEVSPPVPSVPSAQAASQAPAEEGFTLRFASDLALTRLVVRNAVGLYAINPGQSLRMSMNRGTYTFWPASVPNQYHEMEPGTVPASVVAALRRSGSLGLAPDVKWGVTLPNAMSRQLDQYLADYAAGALVIGEDGELRLER